MIAFILEQVAAELHKTKAWLQEWLSKHPSDANGARYYRKTGRTKLFRRSDIDRIFASLAAPCPLLVHMGLRKGLSLIRGMKKSLAEDQQGYVGETIVHELEIADAKTVPMAVGITQRNYPLCTLEPSIALRSDFSCCIP